MDSRESAKMPLLTGVQEAELAQPQLTEVQQVEANLQLVASEAARYKGRGVPFSDLFQEGALALTEAVIEFDDTRGTKLSTFALPLIQHALSDAIAQQSGTISYNRYTMSQIYERTAVSARLCQELQREPTNKEIAKEMGIEAKTAEGITSYARAISMDGEGKDSIREASEKVVAASSPSVEELILLPPDDSDETMFQEVIHAVRESISDPRIADILIMSNEEYGDGMNTAQIAEVYGLTPARVRQLHAAGRNAVAICMAQLGYITNEYALVLSSMRKKQT